ncbi:hypothetical protein ABEB36_007709 [Hypothenemus hampei]|uniref:E3 ubiquitin-protein ligase CHFR n=1 Tax=Hypothenemus hampei TaxID=57062 RepID=A0ABD1EVX5_HYPHA
MASYDFPVLRNITNGEHEIKITKSPYHIGRYMGADYVIKDKFISRRQCTIKYTENGWILQDCSTNGTKVNEEIYKQSSSPPLKNYDKISFDNTYHIFRFLLNAPKDSSPSPESNFDDNNISDEVLNDLVDVLEFCPNISSENDCEILVVPEKDSDDYLLVRFLQDSQTVNSISPTDNNKEANTVAVASIGNKIDPTCVIDLTSSPDCSTEISKIKSEQTISLMKSKRCHSPVSSTTEERANRKLCIEKSQYNEMEEELICTICTCVFIKPVTLSCSHTFCNYCITTWKNKKPECPICRVAIRSLNRTLVLDNIIEKFLENVPLEVRQQREDNIKERDQIEKKMTKSTKVIESNYGGPYQIMFGEYHDPMREVTVHTTISSSSYAITINSSTSTLDSSNESSDSESWVPRPYYGGYGRCYLCEGEGHWANGCPFK